MPTAAACSKCRDRIFVRKYSAVLSNNVKQVDATQLYDFSNVGVGCTDEIYNNNNNNNNNNNSSNNNGSSNNNNNNNNYINQ